MSASDVLLYLGFLAGTWAIGFSMGLGVLMFKRFMESI